VTKLKSSLLRGDKPSFTVSPDSKMDSDTTRSFVTDIAFSILVNFADTSAQKKTWKVVGGGRFFMHCRRCRVESRAPIRSNLLLLQKTLLLICRHLVVHDQVMATHMAESAHLGSPRAECCKSRLVRLGGLLGRQDQGVQRDERAGKLEEGMPQHLVGRRSLLDVHFEAFVKEVLEDGGQLVPLLDLRFAIGGDQVERPQGILVEIRRLSLNHLDGHDPERPDVNFGSVVLSGDHLRGHPVRRPNHCCPLVLLRRDLSTEAEVCQLDLAIHPQKDVIRLDVPVDDIALV